MRSDDPARALNAPSRFQTFRYLWGFGAATAMAGWVIFQIEAEIVKVAHRLLGEALTPLAAGGAYQIADVFTSALFLFTYPAVFGALLAFEAFLVLRVMSSEMRAAMSVLLVRLQ